MLYGNFTLFGVVVGHSQPKDKRDTLPPQTMWYIPTSCYFPYLRLSGLQLIICYCKIPIGNNTMFDGVIPLISEQDMQFEEILYGKKILPNNTDDVLLMKNHSCRRSFCAMQCASHLVCVAFTAKVSQPCICEVFLSLGMSPSMMEDSDWLTVFKGHL